jgi:hypothetical protein
MQLDLMFSQLYLLGYKAVYSAECQKTFRSTSHSLLAACFMLVYCLDPEESSGAPPKRQLTSSNHHSLTHGAQPFLRNCQLCSYSGTRKFITVFTRALQWSLLHQTIRCCIPEDGALHGISFCFSKNPSLLWDLTVGESFTSSWE